MAKHQLSLEIPDTLNACILRIIDTSIYHEDVPIECPEIWVTPPGYWQMYRSDGVDAGFAVNLTACNLGWQVDNCDTRYYDLPDGIYVVRYSVSPHDKVYVEYNHLRITYALNLVNKILCCLNLAGCEPDVQTKAKLKEVQLYYTMLKGAKAKVEYCHHPKQGMDIYNYALSQLKKLSCGCGCGCDDC